MNLTDSDQDLYKQLLETLHSMHPRDRVTAHWVMSKEWADRIAAIRLPHTADPSPVWAYLPDRVLFGYPAEVTDDGGEPHLEARPATARNLSFADLGHLATYNAEHARGIMHTPEWQARMAQLQRRFMEEDSRAVKVKP